MFPVLRWCIPWFTPLYAYELDFVWLIVAPYGDDLFAFLFHCLAYFWRTVILYDRLSPVTLILVMALCLRLIVKYCLIVCRSYFDYTPLAPHCQYLFFTFFTSVILLYSLRIIILFIHQFRRGTRPDCAFVLMICGIRSASPPAPGKQKRKVGYRDW